MDISEDQWRRWTPAAQEKAAAALREISESRWRPFYCPRPHCDGHPHVGQLGEPVDGWTFPHARWNQHPPLGDWLVWLNRGGRGSGKTRTGAEWINRRVKVSPRVALVAPTGPDARDIMVEGESGILATAAPEQRPTWEPSKRKLTWPNGAIGHTYSGEEPDRLRGPQHYDAWVDEPAHMPLIEDVWSNLLFGLRLGKRPRICATTTPLPTKWMKDLIADPSTVSVVASTYDNVDNLAPHFAALILSRYEGTRKGRQEIYGDVLSDVDGALWVYEIIEDYRVDPIAAPEHYDRVVVSIDPAGTHRKKSNETGIIVPATADSEFYVIKDASGKYSPNGWAERALALYDAYSADAIVVETNYGGDMVRSTLESVMPKGVPMPRIIEVTSRRGKALRADPIVALYEKGKVHHVGEFTDLEDQQLSWVPGSESPDRIDALVHGLTDLARIVAPASIASPKALRSLAARMAASRMRVVS